ncbi:hypothetical protein DFJ77DRAFT_512338 [Powellomyces hirtus]|nr:hypothetical protein DFJ77DRAFT_512338 [Powellomyces hirtus]
MESGSTQNARVSPDVLQDAPTRGSCTVSQVTERNQNGLSATTAPLAQASPAAEVVVTPPPVEDAQLQFWPHQPPGETRLPTQLLSVPDVKQPGRTASPSPLKITQPFAVPSLPILSGNNPNSVASIGVLPPLPSPTFSELFYLEGDVPRTPMPQICFTPAESQTNTFWAFWGSEDPLQAHIQEQPSSHALSRDDGDNDSAAERAVIAHEPGLPDEIAVSRGDRMQVIQQYKDGWILGQNLTTHQNGVFPGACLRHLSPAGFSPPFLSSSTRQDSTSAMSFKTSASKWLYAPEEIKRSPERNLHGPLAADDSSHSREEGYAIVEEVAISPRMMRRHILWERGKKAFQVFVLMSVAIALVLGLGLGLGKVRAPPGEAATADEGGRQR